MTASRTHKRIVVCAVGIAVAASIVVIPSAIADPQAGAPACPDNILVAIPGTTETNEQADPNVPVGMLRNVVDPLDSEFSSQELQTYTVPYVATIVNDKAQTYGTSKKEAIDRASQHISEKAAECPGTKFGLTGFSQGADAAGDLASKIGNGEGPVSADRIFAVGLMADPGQSPTAGIQLGAKTTGNGFVGARAEGFGALNNVTASVCDPDDTYCNTPDDAIATQFVGQLGSKIDASDPASSVAGVVTTLLGLDGQPLTDTLGKLNTAVTTGNMLTVPQLALDLAGNVSTLSAKVAEMTIPGADIAPMATTVSQLTDAIHRGDMFAVPGLLATLTPQVITFASQFSSMIGTVVSKLPINEYIAIGTTTARISTNAAAQNYVALPADLGKLVGQVNNAVRKTLRALPLDEFPLLNRLADDLTPGRVLDEVLNYATSLAADSHNSYASKPMADNGRTGADELTNLFRTRITNPTAQIAS
jgi:hypothetical protein